MGSLLGSSLALQYLDCVQDESALLRLNFWLGCALHEGKESGGGGRYWTAVTSSSCTRCFSSKADLDLNCTLLSWNVKGSLLEKNLKMLEGSRCVLLIISGWFLCISMTFFPFFNSLSAFLFVIFAQNFCSAAMEEPPRIQRKLSSFWTVCCLRSTSSRWAFRLKHWPWPLCLWQMPDLYFLARPQSMIFAFFLNRRGSPVLTLSSTNSSTFGTALCSAHRSSASWATSQSSPVHVGLVSTVFSLFCVSNALSYMLGILFHWIIELAQMMMIFIYCLLFRNGQASVWTTHADLLHIFTIFQGTVSFPRHKQSMFLLLLLLNYKMNRNKRCCVCLVFIHKALIIDPVLVHCLSCCVLSAFPLCVCSVDWWSL